MRWNVREGKIEATSEMEGGNVEATTNCPAFWRWEGFIKVGPGDVVDDVAKHASSKDEAELSNVVVDTNVFISLLTDRSDAHRALAKELLLRAEAGEITIVLPQFILFEIAHVHRNLYGVAPSHPAVAG